MACRTTVAQNRGVDCCDRGGYDETFGDRFARRMAKGYRKRGLDRTRERLVGFLSERGIDGASVLEIGGGVGEVQLELLRRGAGRATNLEISTSYEREAARLIEESGMSGRVTRRLVDIVAAPTDVEPADLVVLHRVVCCYPDYQGLLTAAGSHAQRLLVFSYPSRNLLTRAVLWMDNFQRRLRRKDFRGFVHPPERMVAAVEAQGLSLRFRHRTPVWSIAGFERTAAGS